MTKRNDMPDPGIGHTATAIERATQQSLHYRKMDHWNPYRPQAEFFAMGVRYRERALFAATQSGKTEAAAFELACHLTGIYPIWWKGRRFDKPVRAWAVGELLKMTRDIMQKKLCGEPGQQRRVWQWHDPAPFVCW